MQMANASVEPLFTTADGLAPRMNVLLGSARRDSSSAQVAIDGCFLAQRITGAQCFAVETLCARNSLLDSRELGHRFGLKCSRPRRRGATLRNIEFTNVGRGGRILWDQTWLSLHAREQMLVSFAAVGPIEAPAADQDA